ncbi:MAG: Unknown protein [uncultured Sulfurovum sp.]|uniref:DUF302 domain-containing protein n=1 Tax=uncultured Sulfurovum sp. TaxID=269237 RepID=A0A6S6S3X4_9BACT|nr:MAG: Unknown protein [uncultured Sulfurovum sp.]
MRLSIFPKLLGMIVLTMTLTFASVLTELQGTKNLAETDLKAMIGKLDSIGYKNIFKNERVDNKYYKKFQEKNLDLLSFYTVTDLVSLRELLIENPDFAAYAPFSLLAYKELLKDDANATTWYGHLSSDTMLEVIGEKDEALKEKFKLMVSKLDTFVTKELSPTENKKIIFDKLLPKKPLVKMVKDISDVDDIEDYVEEFVMGYDSIFVENKFLLAGFLNLKVQYEDLDLELEAYDAFWISPVCHLQFTNSIFNRGLPHLGVFAPCTVYFYVPKGSGKLHMGYAPIDNWISASALIDKDKLKYMKETSTLMNTIFTKLDFEMESGTIVESTKVETEKAKTGESILIDFYGTKGQPDAALGSMIDNLGKIGFNTSSKNEHIENHYYNKYKVKNVDLLNFYTIFDIESLRPLLLKNPDFGAYAPFNLLAYKKLQDAEGGDTTWYGHLNADTMLKIIGEKDEEAQNDFKKMVSKVDTHLESEMKPTEHKRLSFSTPLPKKPLLKMVKKIGEVEDIEEYVEEFIGKHNLLFVQNKFIIAGFLDIKFEYDDLELDFDEYDAYWVSSLCHFEFSNAVFNNGSPHAASFAPCSVYFYIPKDSGELHVGYASVDNWLATTGITDPKKIAYMKEISASVIRIFRELGFEMEGEEKVEVKAKVVKKELDVKAVEEVKTKTEIKIEPEVKDKKISQTEGNESILINFYGTKGQPDAALGSMIENLGNVGFNTSAVNEHIENHYYNKFKVKNLDLLNFYTVFDITSLRSLLIKNPDFGAYAPFNLLAYKKLQKEEGGDTTWYGHLNADTMLKIIGEQDKEAQDKFRSMMDKIDKHVENEMKPTESKTLTFSKPLPAKPLLKMVKKIGEVEDIEEYVEEFIGKHNLLFVQNKFIIAGFLDIKFEYDDLELDFDEYDAYWVSSLCHFEFSNAVFNNGSPHAGAFAPCSVYFYVPKDSGELHVGYASVDNWLATTGITDPKKIAYMKEISASVIRIFRELGFEMEGEEKQNEAVITQKTPLKEPIKEIKIEEEKPNKITTTHKSIENQQIKTTEVEKKAEVSQNTVTIVIPAVPTVEALVPQPPKIVNVDSSYSGHKSTASIDRSIQYAKRVPPNYLSSEEREKNKVTKIVNLMPGEVEQGRISTYLRMGLISIDEAKSKLKNAGFEVVAVVPLDKKKQLTSIVFTSDALQKLSLKKDKGHLGTLRLLINEKDKKVSITNPLYLAKAFLQNDFEKASATKILKSLVDEFKDVKNSDDKLKFQLLAKYQFMDKLPYFEDHIVVAKGENLKAKLVKNKRVVFSIDLESGATLVGIKLDKRTQKFPKKIGLDNAGMLPYPLLIENGEAKILNPKYYLSLMYPKLTMEQFMTIATVPDAIINECRKVFR